MKKIIMKGILVGIGVLGLVGFGNNKVEAQAGDGFYNVPRETRIEAGSNFSTTSGVRLVENGQQKAFSVYLYKSKTGYRKVSNTHFIDRRVNGTYMLRYESASGKHKAWRKVTVKDTKAPTFTGISNKTINQYSKFSTTSGIKAYDLAEGKKGYSVYLWKNKTGYRKISKKHYINTKYAGKYQLKYVVKDRKGNTSIKYRKITVKAKPKKKVVKTSTKKISITNTVHLNVRAYNQSGWWHEGWGNTIYHHSYAGEALSNIRVGTRIYVNGIPYQAYDKFTVWAPYPEYGGSSYSKQGRFTSRGGKNAQDYMYDAPLRLKTCYDNGYSRDLIVLAKPLTSKTFRIGSSAVSVSAPQ